ncbi:MAG: prepilin-type N-terminal cleavage/methylation domain-containing protein [Candidatus Eremiobacteraeota bacterium]|nr:prepilin-type N-terminal cleavage/methylation domain-containing protein [Candidatus Eremiobacteraeota bacterium]
MTEKPRGLTLTEVIVAIAVIGIIAAIAVPQYINYKSNLILKSEAQKFEAFLAETKATAKKFCVNIEIKGLQGSSGSNTGHLFPSPGACWISPAYADDRPGRAREQTAPDGGAIADFIEARCAANNFYRVLKFPSGVGVSSNYTVTQKLIVTSTETKLEDGSKVTNLQFVVQSKGTPRQYYVFLNDSGQTRVCEAEAYTSGGGGDL